VSCDGQVCSQVIWIMMRGGVQLGVGVYTASSSLRNGLDAVPN